MGISVKPGSFVPASSAKAAGAMMASAIAVIHRHVRRIAIFPPWNTAILARPLAGCKSPCGKSDGVGSDPLRRVGRFELPHPVKQGIDAGAEPDLAALVRL